MLKMCYLTRDEDLLHHAKSVAERCSRIPRAVDRHLQRWMRHGVDFGQSLGE